MELFPWELLFVAVVGGGGGGGGRERERERESECVCVQYPLMRQSHHPCIGLVGNYGQLVSLCHG